MRLVTIDFETYYDQDYSLSRMDPRAYVTDPRFEIIGMAFKRGDDPTVWATSLTDIELLLTTVDWGDTAVLGHNLAFDGSILTRKFAVKPKMWLDTLGMARAEVKPFMGSASLAACAQFFGLKPKGSPLFDGSVSAPFAYKKNIVSVSGIRRHQFTDRMLYEYGEYSKHDVDLTFEIFKLMRPRFSDPRELWLIDRLLRMYLEPLLEIDIQVLAARAAELSRARAEALKDVGASSTEIVSNNQFAALLRAEGVDPPMKTSKATGKPTFAFAKTDEEFVRLLDDPNPRVAALVAARLGVRGSIEESYCHSLMEMGSAFGTAAVTINANGAHTTRASGGTGRKGSVNWQNLKRGSELRRALKAPKRPRRRKIVAADASQIEARCLATLAGQKNIVDAFAAGADVYALAASDIYGYPVDKETRPQERFVGKVGVLSCGYQSGGATFRAMARTLSQGKVVLSIEAADDIVKRWRRANQKIVEYWDAVEDVFKRVFMSTRERREEFGPFVVGKAFSPYEAGYVELPTGLRIWYPEPGYYDFERFGQTQKSFGYRRRVNDRSIVEKSLYGGFCTENLVQGLCRVITLLQGVEIAKYPAAPWVMTAHDENVFCPLEEHAEAVAQACRIVMRKPPEFLPEIPLDCEVGIGDTYLDCK